MGARVFAERGKFKLHSDERDIAVNCQLRHNVWDWCQDNNVEVEYQDTRIGNSFGIDVWRIRDEQQRVLFLLKWGNANRS